MKNLVFAFLWLFCAFSTIVYAQDLGTLRNNADFKKYVINNYNFYHKQSGNILLKNLKVKDKYSIDDIALFNKIYADSSPAEFNSFIISQMELVTAVDKKYNLSSYSQSKLSLVLKPIVQDIYLEIVPVVVTQSHQAPAR